MKIESRETKFKRSVSLGSAMEELEYNGMIEITRVMPEGRGDYTFEYNIEVKE
jgi:hypothetical protein